MASRIAACHRSECASVVIVTVFLDRGFVTTVEPSWGVTRLNSQDVRRESLPEYCLCSCVPWNVLLKTHT